MKTWWLKKFFKSLLKLRIKNELSNWKSYESQWIIIRALQSCKAFATVNWNLEIQEGGWVQQFGQVIGLSFDNKCQSEINFIKTFNTKTIKSISTRFHQKKNCQLPVVTSASVTRSIIHLFLKKVWTTLKKFCCKINLKI